MENDAYAIIECGTTSGPFKMKFTRSWSPHGYDRAVELFSRGFYDNTHFFRCISNFLVQFGITYSQDKELRKFHWSTIPDDPQLEPPIKFRPGIVSFAGGGKDSRSSQLFITYGPGNSLGGALWETPIGEVIEGMDNINNLNKSYADHKEFGGKAPDQSEIKNKGSQWVNENFPDLSRFLTCTVHREKISDNSGSGGERDGDTKENKFKDEILHEDSIVHDITSRRELQEEKVASVRLHHASPGELKPPFLLIASLLFAFVFIIVVKNRTVKSKRQTD